MGEAGGDTPRLLRRPGVLAALGGSALFLFASFIIASFPYDDMAATMLAPYHLKLTYRAQHLRLPVGIALEGVELFSVANSPGQLLLRSPQIALRPALGVFLRGRAGLGLDAQIYSGILYATLARETGAIGVTFSARALSLAESSLPSQFGALLGGTLSAQGSAQILGPTLLDDRGRASIDGRDVTVEITHGFPLIHLGAVSGQIMLANGVLTFHELKSQGGDVEAKADGTIQVGADPADSTIAARVYLTPTASGRAHFGLLFNMLPHPPSEGPYQVRGPLTGPSVS
jgi:type II secretion system protein N